MGDGWGKTEAKPVALKVGSSKIQVDLPNGGKGEVVDFMLV